MTDLGKSASLNIIITKPTIKLVMVMAWKEVAKTLNPMYCNTALYNPSLINNGIAMAGIKIKIHQLDNMSSGKNSPILRENEPHIANKSINTSMSSMMNFL